MRLIDADAYLHKVCTYNRTGCGSCKFQIICPSDEPTVKAIPIEWINSEISRMQYIMLRCSPKVAKGYEERINSLRSLLWNWETLGRKENE